MEDVILIILLVLVLLFALIYAIPKLFRFIARSARKRKLLRKLEKDSQTAPPEVVEDRSGFDILYLRPFKSDNQIISDITYQDKQYFTFEELISVEMEKAGQAVAIGNPAEKFAPRGAKRVYVTKEENWQDVVAELLEQAKLVILYVDFTPGVMWEIMKASGDCPDKLILVPSVYGLDNAQGNATFLNSGMAGAALWLRYYRHHYTNRKTHYQRGRKYYQTWNRVFSEIMKGTEIDDTVCAVTFENGAPVPIRSDALALENRLTTILSVIECKAKGAPIEDPQQNEVTVRSDTDAILSTYGNLLCNFSKWVKKLPSLHACMIRFFEDGFSCKTWYYRKTYVPLFVAYRPKNGLIRYRDLAGAEIIGPGKILLTPKFVSRSMILCVPSRITVPVFLYLKEGITAGSLHSRPNETEQQSIAKENKISVVRGRVFFWITVIAAFAEAFFLDAFAGVLLSCIALAFSERGNWIHRVLAAIAVLATFARFLWINI